LERAVSIGTTLRFLCEQVPQYATEVQMNTRSIGRPGLRCSGLLALLTVTTAIGGSGRISAAPTDIVVHASDVTSWQGNWTRTPEPTAAGGWTMTSVDHGWSTPDRPLASPNHYFEATIAADANINYRVWARLRAAGNSKWNDSLWIQFGDAVDPNGAAVYRIGSADAVLVNLENCNGCGVSGWGWQDRGWWTGQSPMVRFASSGMHTIRVQTREDGVEIDQIVLSGANYYWKAPGSVMNDSTIVPKSGGPNPQSPTPFPGSPVAIPGRIEAENFDNGGPGVAYADTTPGNDGGAYRSTDVDIQPSSEGGHNVGWMWPGEWLDYTVHVAQAGSYSVQLRVASPTGGRLHVGFNNSSRVWVDVDVPNTGGWQTWTTAAVPVTLGNGVQQLTLFADTGSYNLNYVNVVADGGGPPPPSGNTVSALTWNIQINDDSERHARQAMATAMAIEPRPQIVVIQEAYLQHYAVYLDELQRQTGQNWRGAFATHCASGQWNGSRCSSTWYQGIGIFTTYPIVSSDSMLFPFWDCWTSARVGVRAGINVNGVILQVFGTHLQTGGCANDEQSRYNSISMLKSWASNQTTPQVVAGDFNADPNQIASTRGMAPQFVDTWPLVGSGNRFTAFTPNPSMQLDYWFTDVNGRAAPQSSEVVSWTGTVSDHYPVRTTFVVR
jgi:endonuclease/exonuclease/phosphatase family metal-dependent hydrolase